MESMWLRRATTSAAGAAGLALLSLPSAAVCERGSYTACASTACSSKEEFLAMMSKVQAQRTKAVDSPREAAEAQAGPVPDMSLCPPDRAELGFHSWQLLHSLAAHYPDRPTQKEQAAARGILMGLGLLYPCRHCAAHLQEHLEKHPPTLASREELALYLCKLHNQVNSFLDKEQFPCNMAALDERWLTGHSECWQAKAESARASLGQESEVAMDSEGGSETR